MYHRQVAPMCGWPWLVPWGYAMGMADRRQFLAIVGSSLVLTPLVAWISRQQGLDPKAMADTRFPVEKTDAEWRASLEPAQYAVLRRAGTERPFTSALNHEQRQGVFSSAAGAQKLGHPVPLSYFISDVKTGRPQPAQVKTPGRFSSLSGLEPGRSVPSSRRTWN